jgi:hypothetical protein
MSLSDAERRTMGREGRDWMKRDFSWNAIGQQMSDAYRWLAGYSSECPVTVCHR